MLNGGVGTIAIPISVQPGVSTITITSVGWTAQAPFTTRLDDLIVRDRAVTEFLASEPTTE